MSLTPERIQSRINSLDSSCDPACFILLAACTTIANTNISFSVSNICNLPDLAISNIPSGQIVYVEEIGVPVVSSGGVWRGLDGRVLRRDLSTYELWSWGRGDSGQLGNGFTTPLCRPFRQRASNEWVRASAGTSASLGLKRSGELYGWGFNNCGHIGDGTVTPRCSPVREITRSGWCEIASGWRTSFGIKKDGTLWGWGINDCGSIGDGTTTNTCSPVREICSSTNWIQVSASRCTTVALKSDGSVWSWGFNTSAGRLGDGTAVDKCSPIREICSATNWCMIDISDSCSYPTIALKTDGSLWGWGYNTCGTIGDGTTTNRCSPVRERCSATDWCTISARGPIAAIKTDGSLWLWGFSICGSLANGSLTNTARCSPVRETCSDTTWCSVSSGNYSQNVVAIKTNGSLWAWGVNSCGQLGDGTTTCRSTPNREVMCKTNWSCASLGSSFVVALAIV